MRSYFEELCFYYGEMEAFARYERQAGKLILATAQENDTTRLFMRSLNPISDERQRNGWWNTFTITRKPCAAGTYICEIKDVRSDKDGYPIFVAEPLVQVDDNLHYSDEVMYVFYLSRLFTEASHINFGEFNIVFMAEKINELAKIHTAKYASYYEAAAASAVQLFIDGVITREQISAWLNEPTDWQKQEEAFNNEVLRFFNMNLAAMSDTTDISGMISPSVFQLTAEKCLKFKTEHELSSVERKANFVKDLLAKYEYAVNAGQIQAVNDQSIWHQIEAYLKFDKNRKQAQKAAKTAAKKAKKATAKA